jgi:hypothetical protein
MNMLFCFGQSENDSLKVKTNPIIYADFLFGGSNSGNEVNGLTLGFGVNYQINKDLLTFRTTYIAEKNDDAGLAAILIFPMYIGGDSMNEFALLYGKRFIFNSSALSVSVGVSTNLLKYTNVINNESLKFRKSYVAIPFELNFHLFKGEKRRFRVLYGIIPIGKPTSFGRSFGVKLFGSFGTYNYFGIGINLGLGWHKNY